MPDREVLSCKGLDTRVRLGSVDSGHFDCVEYLTVGSTATSITSKDWLNQSLAATVDDSSSIRAHNLMKFGRFVRLIELTNYLRSSVHAGVMPETAD